VARGCQRAEFNEALISKFLNPPPAFAGLPIFVHIWKWNVHILDMQ